MTVVGCADSVVSVYAEAWVEVCTEDWDDEVPVGRVLSAAW